MTEAEYCSECGRPSGDTCWYPTGQYPNCKAYQAQLERMRSSAERLDEIDYAAPIESDGGSTAYYQLPRGARELNDLIEHKKMSFAQGNIFKATYRLGEKAGASRLYDIRKILYFAKRMEREELKRQRNGK